MLKCFLTEIGVACPVPEQQPAEDRKLTVSLAMERTFFFEIINSHVFEFVGVKLQGKLAICLLDLFPAASLHHLSVNVAPLKQKITRHQHVSNREREREVNPYYQAT